MPQHPPGTPSAEQKAKYPEETSPPPVPGPSAAALPSDMSPDRWRQLAEVKGGKKSIQVISSNHHPLARAPPATSEAPPPAPSSSSCQSHDIRLKPCFEGNQGEDAGMRQENWQKWTKHKKQAQAKAIPTPEEAEAEAKAREGIEQHIAATLTADSPPPPPAR